MIVWWTDINDEEETEFEEYAEAPMTRNWLAYFAAYDPVMTAETVTIKNSP